MLSIQPSKRSGPIRGGGVGLAIAGGGPLGAIYALGTLRALENSLKGIDLNELQAYVGVSSGSFIAAGLANRMSAKQMCDIFIDQRNSPHPFHPESLLRPAWHEYWRSVAKLPGLIADAVKQLARKPLDWSLAEPLARLADLIPTGLFDNQQLDRYLTDVFTGAGRSNDFRELAHKLFVVAVDLDSGASVRFGEPGYEHVPISKAVQASAALPGLYPPVQIDGRNYVDGALRRTLHASVILDEGIDLLIGINPLVPFDGGQQSPPQASLARRGLPLVLSQTFRALIQSRMQIGIARYQSEYDADLLLMEPNRDDARMFFTNLFSYADRRELYEHAYQAARADLAKQQNSLQKILARHGAELDLSTLPDPPQSDPRPSTTGLATPLSQRLRQTLDRLERFVSSA